MKTNTTKNHSFYSTLKNFILCGLSGWCLECFWTGLHSLVQKKDKYLRCNTSIWMFPIYGMAVFLSPVYEKCKNHCTLFRGGVYTCFIFLTEFVTGCILKKHHACPWDYSHTRLNFKGVIRLDFAPLWFVVGLLYENLLIHPKTGLHKN